MMCFKFLLPLAIISLSQGRPFPHNDHGYSYVTKHDGHYGGHGSGEGDGSYQAYSTGHLGGNESHDGGYEGEGDSHEDYYHHPKYAFEYGVKDAHTGDHKKHWETRDGDVVKGGYTVDEPDGTKLEVEYIADKHSGFNAIVKRTGHAHHPEVYGKGHGSYEQDNGGNGGQDGGHGHHGGVSYSHVSQHY